MDKKPKPILFILGPSNSGKTTSIEKIITRLKDIGIKCATIKFMHHPTLSIDPPGKDSSRHREAGALYSINFAPKETAIIVAKSKRDEINEVQKIISSLSNILPAIDLIICESLNNPPENSFVFISANSLNEVEKYSKNLIKCKILAIVGNISNDKNIHKFFNELPIGSVFVEKELNQLIDLIKGIL